MTGGEGEEGRSERTGPDATKGEFPERGLPLVLHRFNAPMLVLLSHDGVVGHESHSVDADEAFRVLLVETPSMSMLESSWS